MGRRRLLFAALGTLVLVLGLAACPPAGAATFTWNMPATFTAASPGANPDSDSYGARPWTYGEAAPCQQVPVVGTCLSPPATDPTQAGPLPQFGAHGSATGWSDPNDPDAFIGVDPATPGQLVMTAAADAAVVLGWHSQLAHAATVTASLTITSPSGTPCFSWSLDQNSQAVLSGSGPTGAQTASLDLAPADAVYLTILRTGSSAACATAGVQLTLSETEPGGPALTLVHPAAGSVYTGAQPTYSGLASTASSAGSTVAVRVYAGAATGGTPVESLTATRAADGTFTAGPGARLADGTYTAQAEQDDSAGDRGLSAPATFSVFTSAPKFKLHALGTGPLRTATPTITGTAGTAAGDGADVAIAIYPGASTLAGAVRYATVARDARTGAFSSTVRPALPDGQYTAIAAQDGRPAGVSQPLTFRIKVNPPALTLTVPPPGGRLAGTQPTFRGAAGDGLGDAGHVTVALHAGDSPRGRSLGTRSAAVSGGAWSLRWPARLAHGTYTVVVVQSDDAGHTTTVESAFAIVPPPTVLGSQVVLRGTTAAVAVTCTAPASTTCTGTVLGLTARSLRPRAGGPSGPVRVIFAYVRIPGGRTETVRSALPAYVAALLRRTPHLQVRLVAQLTGVGRATALRPLHP